MRARGAASSVEEAAAGGGGQGVMPLTLGGDNAIGRWYGAPVSGTSS